MNPFCLKRSLAPLSRPESRLRNYYRLVGFYFPLGEYEVLMIIPWYISMSPFCLKAIFFLGDTSSVVLWSFWHLLKKSLKALRFVLLYLSNMLIQEKITTFIRSILKNNSIIKRFKWALRHCTVVSRRLKDSGRSIMTVFRLVLLEFLNSATFP